MEKKLDARAVCDEQPCEKLKRFHEFSADAKAGFDTLVSELT
jgi:hypothetical protein